MRLNITLLGLDLLSVELTTDSDGDNGTDPGDCTTYPIGFTANAGDQAWESGVDR